MTTTPLPAPREPEIETLGRVVRVALWTLRRIAWLGGAAAVAWAVFLFVSAPDEPYAAPGVGGPHELVGMGIAWLCLGIPLLSRADWLFGRGRWLMFAGGAVLWFVPGFLLDEHELMFLLRVFASLVAIAVLAVWRTLYALTKPEPGNVP
ncbi:MAG: hypothetical protein KDC98_16460 [Planctomycetes bacterium]|nr:hypothetical protein [Planctomycetota bacterium]